MFQVYDGEVMAAAWAATIQSILTILLTYFMIKVFDIEDCQLKKPVIFPKRLSHLRPDRPDHDASSVVPITIDDGSTLTEMEPRDRLNAGGMYGAVDVDEY